MKISFLTTIIIAVVLFKIIKMIVEANRDAKMARVKADLKIRLLDRVQDPVLLRDILDKDLDLSPEGLQLHKEAWDRKQSPTRTKAARKDGGWRFVSGMVFFFIGLGLLVMSLFGTTADAEEAWQPAIFFILYGWVMLGWHVYSQERNARAPQTPHDLHA
jgi:hypothetical protein